MSGFPPAFDGISKVTGVTVELNLVDGSIHKFVYEAASFDGSSQRPSVRQIIHITIQVTIEDGHEQIIEVLIHVRRLGRHSHSSHVGSCQRHTSEIKPTINQCR